MDDKEPKYGLSVTGVVRPGDEVTNAGARPGDVLVLTKPIGTGIITTAGKQGVVSEDVLAGAIRQMSTLNRDAAHAMMAVGVNACSDITGFGLLGHLKGIVLGSGVSARIRFSSIPVLDGVWDLLGKGIAPGGTHRNLDAVEADVRWGADIDENTRILLADAQTSGGLLISVSSDKRDDLLSELQAAGVETRAVVGEVLPEDALDGKRIEVVP